MEVRESVEIATPASGTRQKRFINDIRSHKLDYGQGVFQTQVAQNRLIRAKKLFEFCSNVLSLNARYCVGLTVGCLILR